MQRPGRHKLEDAARVLPAVGAVLVALPLLWRDDMGWRSATVLIYLLVVWVAMIALAAFLAWRLRGDP